MTAAWAQGDGFIEVNTTKKLWDAITADNSAKVRLTADIALSDIDKDGETYCNTFSGTIDGNGHTIKGDPVASVRARTYMFENANGATFKNLTFKGIRVNSDKNPNQAIITAKADNGCVFENITFENVHTWTNKDNAGSAAGWARDCTFRDITVRNSEFTTDDNQAGAVVGHAINCYLRDIKIENCEITSAADFESGSKSGGVVGRSDNGEFEKIKVLGTFVKTYDQYAGGVAGYSYNSDFRCCSVDDQSCVYADGGWFDDSDAYSGGIVGYAERGLIFRCINSALTSSNRNIVGGMVGYAKNNIRIEHCLNTGMVVYIDKDNIDEYYSKYKNKQLPCMTKIYDGKEYIVRKADSGYGSWRKYGGIVGYIDDSSISYSANIGSMNVTNFETGGLVGIARIAATITNCLSDFHCPSYASVYGLIGYCEGNPSDKSHPYTYKFTNCVNATKAEDYGESHHYKTFNIDNLFSFKRNNMSEAELAFGQICLKLGDNWEQNIGTNPCPTPTGNYGVYHTRMINNQYGTVCLPFSVQSDDKISYYSLSRKEEDGQGIKLVFTYNEDRIPEGTPLLFRSAEAKDADADNPVEISFNNAGEEFTTTPTNKIFDAGFWDLWGTFEQRVFEDDLAKNIYYVSGGEIRNAKKTTIAPYRAWIYGENIDNLTGSGAQAKAIKLVLAGENGETTALELVGDDLAPVQQGVKSYSLMGTEVGDGYRGLVISNGKKVIQNR